MSWQLASLAIVCAALAARWFGSSCPAVRPPCGARRVARGPRGPRTGRLRGAAGCQADHRDRSRLRHRVRRGTGIRRRRARSAALEHAPRPGPVDPWQMLGWGLVGLFGALVGRLTNRRAGPFTIAVACAVAAELFNLVVDLFTLSTTGNHSLAVFGVVLAAAAPFDVTHVIASFVFGLAFGAPLLRILMRARARMASRWSHDGVANRTASRAGAAVALLVALVAPRPRPRRARGPTSPRCSGPARIWSVPKTATAASARRRACRAASSTRRGRPLGLRPPASRRSPSYATATRSSRRSRPKPARSTAPATSSARCSRSTRRAHRSRPSPGAGPYASCSPGERRNGSFEGLVNLDGLRGARAARRRPLRARSPDCAGRPMARRAADGVGGVQLPRRTRGRR